MLQFDREQFEKQLDTLYPEYKRQWLWEIAKTFSNHLLIRVTIHIGQPVWSVLVIWFKAGDVWELDTLDKFVQLIETEDLTLGHNLQDILEIFCEVQKKKIIEDVTGLDDWAYEWKLPSQSAYAKTIGPISYSVDAAGENVRFWTIDHGYGYLEEWLFKKTGKDFSIQSWIREKDFVIPLGWEIL